MRLLAEFVYLQLLDVLTTVAFLMQGVAEGNPIVRWAIEQGSNPWQGLFALKLGSVLLAFYCVRRARHTLLRRVNIFFALLVAYNLVALIIGSAAA